MTFIPRLVVETSD